MSRAKFALYGNTSYPPTKGTLDSAGWDLYSPTNNVVHPRSLAKINLYLKFDFPPGTYGQLCSRSSVAKNQVIVVGGVIDRDYRGFVEVMLMNCGNMPFEIKTGDRIAQLVIHKINTEELEQWTHLPDDPALESKIPLPKHYADLLPLLMEEVRAIAAHNDPASEKLYSPADFAARARAIVAARVSLVKNKVRGTGGFGST